MTNALMMTSQTVEWATPQGLFDELDREFHFTVDAAADASNAKCDRYFSIEDSGLSHSWDGEVVWCNPPYGRQIAYWVEKAATAIATTVMLLPVRTDVQWFHRYVLGRAEIRFIEGRIKFGDGSKDAPFPCMVVVFRGDR